MQLDRVVEVIQGTIETVDIPEKVRKQPARISIQFPLLASNFVPLWDIHSMKLLESIAHSGLENN